MKLKLSKLLVYFSLLNLSFLQNVSSKLVLYLLRETTEKDVSGRKFRNIYLLWEIFLQKCKKLLKSTYFYKEKLKPVLCFLKQKA